MRIWKARQAALARKPKDQTWSERREELMRKHEDLIKRSAFYLETGRIMEAASFRARERGKFHKTITTMEKSVEIPCGFDDFLPLLDAVGVAEYGLVYSNRQRYLFEAATRLMLIPDNDDPMQIG